MPQTIRSTHQADFPLRKAMCNERGQSVTGRRLVQQDHVKIERLERPQHFARAARSKDEIDIRAAENRTQELHLEVARQRGKRTDAQGLPSCSSLLQRAHHLVAGREDRVGMVENDLSGLGQMELPRSRTAGLDLAGRAFLHDYDWRRDEGFGVLELILTAPVVVASWISLQYYGSTVAPDVFGAGNKLLHNVTGGIGVVEGNGGLLRTGLPWQSVHDGERLIHEPLRLSVLIEAPRDVIGDILERHPDVRALFDNRWLHLFALDDKGGMAWRYKGDLCWENSIRGADAEPDPLRVTA